MPTNWEDLKRDAEVLLECANALHRAPRPVDIHPSQVVEMCDKVIALVRAARWEKENACAVTIAMKGKGVCNGCSNMVCKALNEFEGIT